MIKYFYLVEFECSKEDNTTSSFDLGVFSTKKKAEEKIKMSANLEGFKDYGIDCFRIIKFGVNFDYDVNDKSKIILYCVYHEYEDEDEEFTYYCCVFDYFSTMEEANAKVEYLKRHSRVGKKHPNNFEIAETIIDNYNSWSKGFVEVSWPKSNN